jgi:pimeloyl-ACP methyl ester carboxylesterase
MSFAKSQRIGSCRRKALGLAVLVALAGASGAAHAALTCEGLAAVTTADATITSAAVAGPGLVQGQNVAVAMCRVQGVARPSTDSEIKFEVWLPLQAAWTGRMKVNGTGGYAGATPYNRLAQDVGDGFVTAGSNMGHDGGENASWTLGRPEKVKDWGLRAHYSVATAAKALAAAHYDQPVAYSYFEGCSNGGRQAMMMAQNYPQLFDGIVSGAPSMFYPDLLMWLLWTGKAQVPVMGGGATVPDAKRAAVTAKVMAQCDAVDGLVDNQITNPSMCHFDIDSVGPAPGGDGTLTAAELAVFKAMYAGTTSETGQQRYAGAVIGSEADWVPLFADNGGYGPFIGHYVYSTLTFDFRAQPNLFSTIYDEAKAALSPITAAPSPNIDEFVARGGKLVHTHGLNDVVVTPGGSTAYFYALTQWERLRHLPKGAFDQQVEKLTPQVVAATAQAFGKQVSEYHRLFLLPGVAHCGGGTGPSSIGGGYPEPPAAYRNAETHAVSAVMKWVEQGVAPEKIVATRFSGANVVRQRPACPYPAQAVYDGVGDINAASSFSCATPKLQDREVSSGEMVLLKNSLRYRDLKLPNR